MGAPGSGEGGGGRWVMICFLGESNIPKIDGGPTCSGAVVCRCLGTSTYGLPTMKVLQFPPPKSTTSLHLQERSSHKPDVLAWKHSSIPQAPTKTLFKFESGHSQVCLHRKLVRNKPKRQENRYMRCGNRRKLSSPPESEKSYPAQRQPPPRVRSCTAGLRQRLFT